MSVEIALEKNKDRLRQAIGCAPGSLGEGILQNLFAWAFTGLVYPQIWEDPEVDMAALAMTPDCHVVAIASGGCNILSYLTANPRRITAIDLNSTHVALCRLKLAAVRHLPSWQSFYRFFGDANQESNIQAYRDYLRSNLDSETRSYWEERRAISFGRQRISVFAKNFYRHGLLGRFIGLGHAVARAYGADPKLLLRSRSLEEQRIFFDSMLAPLFDKRLVRWATSCRLSLFGLGIPPAQYESLVSAGAGDMATVLRSRLERLSCGFGLTDNYFTWQAFGRAYESDAGPLPPYLRRANFDCLRARAERVEVFNLSMTEYLKGAPDRSLDRFVLLYAQDWMTDAQLNALWKEITRTAREGARVIFRTAANPSLLPGRVDDAVLARWRYADETSRRLTERDRSAIYGGFHLYILERVR